MWWRRKKIAKPGPESFFLVYVRQEDLLILVSVCDTLQHAVDLVTSKAYQAEYNAPLREQDDFVSTLPNRCTMITLDKKFNALLVRGEEVDDLLHHH